MFDQEPPKPPHVEHLEEIVRAGEEWRAQMEDVEISFSIWRQGWFWGAVGAVLALASLVVVVLSALGYIG